MHQSSSHGHRNPERVVYYNNCYLWNLENLESYSRRATHVRSVVATVAPSS